MTPALAIQVWNVRYVVSEEKINRPPLKILTNKLTGKEIIEQKKTSDRL